ncbi:hypothetical protein TNCV_746591 [Trichonephila clavipes]|nr:hypothetical protein TNCV_746591 [Trichonephila clavipes]
MLLARWIVRSVPLEIVESSGGEKVPTRGKPGLEQPGRLRGDKVSDQLNARPCGGMYCSWRWSNELLKLHSFCVVAHPVFV